MSRVGKSLLLLIAAVLVSSCYVGLGQLPVRTAVVQNGGPLQFTFFVCPYKYLVAGERVGWRTPVRRFELWRAEDLLWEVATRDQHRGAAEITYGVVPQAFEQRIPKNNQAPPELKPDEAYKAVAVWDGYAITTFTYQRAANYAPSCE
jgi:hypothetical protein